MKFLVLLKRVVGAPGPENLLAAFQAAKEYLNAMLADGTLDCGYALPDGSGVAIGNFDSHEELWEKMSAFPFFPSMEYEVYPLLDVNYLWDKSIERLQKMGGG